MKPEDRLVHYDLLPAARDLGYGAYAFDQGYRPPACPACGASLGRDAGGTRQTEGVADLYLVRDGLHVWVEAKAGSNTPTDDQEAFLLRIRRAEGDAFVAWCTSDLLWGLHLLGDHRISPPPWAETSTSARSSPRFREWFAALYPDIELPEPD